MPHDPRPPSGTPPPSPVDSTASARSELTARRERERLGLLLAMSEVISLLVHDVNQPLAAIVTNANAAKRWLASSPADLAEASAASQRIAHEGNRASQIIERTRAQLKTGEVHNEPVAVEELLRELALSLRDDAAQARATLRIQVAAGLPRVLCDRTRLEQVVLHLVHNALEALANSDVQTREIELGASFQSKTEVCIRVRDSGPGLAGDRELPFQPFYTTKSQALGLGLNICRSLVRSFGGRLWALANSDGGETFHFTLPVALDRT
jgi:two-component system, LuxR family, sensor kinase FixL